MESIGFILLLPILVGCANAQFSGGVDGTYRTHPYRYGRINGYLQYQKDRFSIRGSGWYDTDRQWGAGVGLRFEFKRSVKKTEGTFHLSIKTSECNFAVYDINGDGFITRNEVHVVFADVVLAEKLFKALDIITRDEVITVDEFYFMSPKIIYGCQRERATQKSSSEDQRDDAVDEPIKNAEDEIENE